MKLKINLLTNSVIKAIDTPVILTGESEFKISFNSSVYAPTLLKVGVKCNNESQFYNLRFDEELDILPLLKAGKLEITIWQIVSGAIVKKWQLLPIILTEIEQCTAFELKDYISALEERVLALEEAHKTAFDE